MRAIKSLLFVACLAAPGSAVADRPPDGPDFHSAPTVRGDVDREMAASEGRRALRPFDVVHFALDSAELDTVDLVQVRAAARWMASHPDHALMIEGHTDHVGSAAYNEDLARRRAERVRDVLLAAGVPEARLVVFIYGEHKPVSSSHANNRRVRLWAAR